MLGAILVPGLRQRERGLAREVAALFGRVIPGFGASDCGCEGHLFHPSMLHVPTRTGTSQPAGRGFKSCPRYPIYVTVLRDGRFLYAYVGRWPGR